MNKKTLPPPPDFDSPEEAKDIIHFLWNKLTELEDRLNQNSRNSSVPSSQQSLHNKAKNTSPNRKKSGKKPGAQPGHKGHRRLLHPIEDSASVEQYLPKKTCHCGGCVIPNRKPYKRHQIFDLPDISYTLVEHQVFKGECSWCGDKHQAELPEHVSDVQMGPNLHSFIAIQATQHHQSIGKIQSMLKDVFQLNFSTGAISAAQGRVTEYLADTHTQIHETVKASQLIMADETSHQRNNEKRWMWAALSNDVAFFQNQQRSKPTCG